MIKPPAILFFFLLYVSILVILVDRATSPFDELGTTRYDYDYFFSSPNYSTSQIFSSRRIWNSRESVGLNLEDNNWFDSSDMARYQPKYSSKYSRNW